MIKSFIYLDEQKMYSLSSQIFEGITEYVLKEDGESNERSEEQKGPVGSGRLLGDVIRKGSRSTEKKFVHDYAFTVFEKYVESEGRVAEFSGSAFGVMEDDVAGLIDGVSFLKVRGRAVFNDYSKIANMLSDFNNIGEALAYAGVFEQLKEIQRQYEVRAGSLDRNQKSRLDSEYKRLTDISKIAKDKGLWQDPKFLKYMAYMIGHGFQDQFEVSQAISGMIFSSCLNRDLLRDDVDLLIKKYSRKTERELVVFGLVSQAFSRNYPSMKDNESHSNLRAALANLTEHVANIENSISGKQENEIVIDPIAVYFEI